MGLGASGINGVAAHGTRDRCAHFGDRLLGPAVTAGLRALRAAVFAGAALVTGSEGTFHSILSLLTTDFDVAADSAAPASLMCLHDMGP